MTAMRVLLFLAMVVATWRLARLLVLDAIRPVAAVREWFIWTFGAISPEGNITGGKRWGVLGWSLAYVWTCLWCMSPWAGVALWGLAELGHVDVPYPWLIIACGSGLAGVMGMVEHEHEQRSRAHNLEATKYTAEQRKQAE